MAHRILAAASLVALLALGQPAFAQAPIRPGITPPARPAFSPYLNLLRPGGTPTLNYYGIVRPELAFRDSILGLQNAVDINRQLITTGGGAPGQTDMLVTGRGGFFLNTGGYFLNLTGGAGPGRGTIASPGGAAAIAGGARPGTLGTTPTRGRIGSTGPVR